MKSLNEKQLYILREAIGWGTLALSIMGLFWITMMLGWVVGAIVTFAVIFAVYIDIVNMPDEEGGDVIYYILTKKDDE